MARVTTDKNNKEHLILHQTINKSIYESAELVPSFKSVNFRAESCRNACIGAQFFSAKVKIA